MAELIVVSWRDIPAQVLVKAGRRTARRPLSDRFQEAIDRAAMHAGLHDTDAYLGEWRRVAAGSCGDDLEAEVERAAARLEADYPPERLRELVENGGLEPRERRIQRMTDTVVSSASKEVVIGFEQPFCIIGERINPTGRRQLAAQMAVGDYSQVEADALAQVAAGRAHAGRQRRHSARRRAAHPGRNHPAGAVAGRRAALDRFLDRRRARGRPRGLPGQAAGQLGHRRGRAARERAAADQEVRRRSGGHLQRRDRHLRGSGRALRGGARRSSSAPRTTASRAPMWSSTP